MSIEKKSTKRAKEELREITDVQYNINILKEQIEEIDTILKGGAIQYGDKVQSSTKGKEDLHIKLIGMKQELNDMIGYKMQQMLSFNRRVYKLKNNKYEIILRTRYVKGYQWKEIADKLDKSVGHIHRLHNEALIAYEKLLELEDTRNVTK